ncbi:MAG: ATP cone domain-containing protein [Candidatus Odinarchaeia archaeon]
MEKLVIKRDGRTEEFIKEKIVVSCTKCGVPPNDARVIADIVEQEITFPVKSDKIMEIILRELAKRDKEWVTNWEIYEHAVKKRH